MRVNIGTTVDVREKMYSYLNRDVFWSVLLSKQRRQDKENSG